MKKNLLTNPITLSQPAGAALAYMGIEKCIPLWHGVQGCSAFGKVLFIQHFREPMPFQTSALTQTTVVMGGEGNLTESLDNIRKNAELVGILTTGVAETCGSDILRVVKEYEMDKPDAQIVSVQTPDFEGCLETGYVKTCKAVLEKFSLPRESVIKKQVAVFIGPYFTPAEVEEIRNIIEDFGFDPIILPDIGDSLNGYLTEEEFSPCSIGGTPLHKIKHIADSALLISIGSSMEDLAFHFAKENGLSSYHFDSLSTLDDLDSFFELLRNTSGKEPKKRYLKQRSHLLDTLLDTQFYLAGKEFAIAGDPEFIHKWKQPLEDIGAKITALSSIKTEEFEAGDLGELKEMLLESPVDFLVGSTHVADLAEELSIPVVRTGIPVSDRIGEPQAVRIGYQGAARLYMECANVIMANVKHTEPYVSSLRETL